MRWLAGAILVVCGCRESARLPGPISSPSPPRAPAFSCQGVICAQPYPRMPDDGEWTCADQAGATLCVGGARAAGVAAAPPDPSWTCGPRRGGLADQLGGRVCLDRAPDFPDGRMAGWRCRTAYDPIARRVCVRAPEARTLADACDRAHPCFEGSRCALGRCVPAGTPPDCWLDGDCPGRRCRFGSCGEASP